MYDDKIVIYYNIKDGKQISYIEACGDIPNSEADLEALQGSIQYQPFAFREFQFFQNSGGVLFRVL